MLFLTKATSAVSNKRQRVLFLTKATSAVSNKGKMKRTIAVLLAVGNVHWGDPLLELWRSEGKERKGRDHCSKRHR